MTPYITLSGTKKDIDPILDVVDREGEVVVVKENRKYHIHRLEPHELQEDEAVRVGEKAEKEYQEGKTRSLDDFIKTDFPEYAGSLENQAN